MTKKRKPRKPKLEGWDCFEDPMWKSGPGIIHKKSGRWWVGKKNIKAMGKYFLKVAEYYEALGK